MKKASSSLVATSACAWAVSALLSAAPSGQTPASPALSATDDPGAELFVQTCNRCHDGARITAIRRTKAEWEDVITKMIEKGAQGTEDDFQNVFGYLRRHYGKVYINTATPDEITTTLGLSKKDADALLAYRKANGNFQDFDAVKKVPDIDLKALDDHKDAIAF